VVVDRGSRYIELVNPENWETAGQPIKGIPSPNLNIAIYVDSSTVFTSPGTLTLTGLTRLEGREVFGLADGIGFGPLTVDGSGNVTLPSSFDPATLTTVTVGLPVYYTGQTMRIDQSPNGSTQSLNKSISDVYVRVYNSMGGAISNGTIPPPVWISGHSYLAGVPVISPETEKAYSSLVATSGTTDPSEDPTNWAEIPLTTYQVPVPLPYVNNPAIPFPVPQLVTKPTDIRIQPQQMQSPTADPIYQVQGRDAYPLTVLALILKYDVNSVP
jgi:hypothetical protein